MFIVEVIYTKKGHIVANGSYITKEDLRVLEQCGNSFNIWAKGKDIKLESYAKNYLASALQKSIRLIEDRNITVHRRPCKAEIAFGYGGTHYFEMDIDKFKRKDGTLKKRIKYNGLWYCR